MITSDDNKCCSSQKVLGGSALLDLGIYTLQFAQFIFKEEPEQVTAVGELNSDGVDIIETVVLEYGGSKRAVLNINGTLQLWNNATVVGTRGRATVRKSTAFDLNTGLGRHHCVIFDPRGVT